MKKLDGLLITVLFVLLVWSCSGCSSLPNVVKAAALDNASVALKITTPWGSTEYNRSMPVKP